MVWTEAGSEVAGTAAADSPVLRASAARNRRVFSESLVTAPLMISEGNTLLRP
jgi:hypothetical protein